MQPDFCILLVYYLYLDKWPPHLCHGGSWVAPHYHCCTVSHWPQSLHSWCIQELVHFLHQSGHHQLKLPLKITQYNVVQITNYNIPCSYYLHPPYEHTWWFHAQLPAYNCCLFLPPLIVHVTHSTPESLHTDFHCALTLPLSTNKTKISRATLRLGGGVSLTDNAGYRASEMMIRSQIPKSSA